MSEPPAPSDAAIRAAGSNLAAEHRSLFTVFARQVLRGVETHPAGGEAMLGTLALEAFVWAEQRKVGETRIRLRNPEDRPGHTVLEVLQDDRAFILDSLRLLLGRFQLQERFSLHPILAVDRDAEGRLLAVAPKPDGAARESYVYIEFAPRIAPEDLANFEHAVRQVAGWVGAATEDHGRMLRAVGELVANLEAAGDAIEGGPERAAKVGRFLDFIADGRFVFIGMRRYAMRGVDGQLEVQVAPNTGLGMWRDDRTSRLFEPQRGEAIPEELRDDIDDDRLILIGKARLESRIHRRGRLDRLVVKEHDARGRVTGFSIIVGLFTLRLLRTLGSQIPLLSERLREVLVRIGAPFGSHDHKALVAAFDSAPVELLIASDVEMLTGLLQELVAATGSKQARLVLRLHPRGRALYAAVLLPREHYREDLRGEIRRLLERLTGASYIDDRTTFVDEGTAVIHCFCTAAEGRRLEPDQAALEREIRTLCSPWEDQLIDALRGQVGEAAALELAGRYESAFPGAVRARTHPNDAVRDVQALEELAASGQPQIVLYFDHADAQRATATLRFYLREAPLLSDVMGVVDHFGLRVVDAQLSRVEPAGLQPAAVESLRILPLGADQADLDAIAPRLSQALATALTGTVACDPLDGLVLGAGLDWRQVDCMRAYLEYFVQIQGALSRPFLREVLLENPLAVRLLVQLFEARHDPSLAEEERERRVAGLAEGFQVYRDRISTLNEDRALSGFFDLIQATLRTNFFAGAGDPHRIVFKFDSARVRGGDGGVVPYREIFVHSAQMKGIHLRGGPVARGGLRWSDRHDDLREEILDLMSTQMLKNGIIVPVGAKGGFVLNRAVLHPGEARALADEQYRVFISSLLDVTDNLAPDGSVVPPAGVRCLDAGDPYLVVAADKGTAHLSDAANEIAVARDFWLGDAFASGGSEGYDHKKYAITARGAWECVKHHFGELGIDPERQDYSVAGIGDMSGDVFGNGLLLTRRARLLAAFDHRHVFLDPDPDAEASWRERKRLFDLPRSSWADYGQDVFSPGGGVYPRSAKRIPVPEALRERLGLEAEAVSGPELVKAILCMEVDLFWNGGIGTYVKATSESHEAAGDRANDGVRIDATQLRARVVGEGGNLGLTQAARVEASLCGVRLDTDAIDNSAGVDLSDHEVNYKVALAPLVRSGRLGPEARRELLFSVADEACEAVLAHNRSQALALSLDERRSRGTTEPFLRAVDSLCEFARLDPADLDLPDAAAASDRAGRGMGFTRPELAVLLGLAKLQVTAELATSEVAQLDYVEPSYVAYFPQRFRDEQPDALRAHHLRAEIGVLGLANRLVDAGGATLFPTLMAELGVGAAEVVSAVLQAEDILRIPDYRRELLALLNSSREGVYGALIELDEGVRTVARYLVRSGSHALDAERIERCRSGLDVLRGALAQFSSLAESQRLTARRERLESQGLPTDLAVALSALPLADRGLNVLRLCESSPVTPVEAARSYARLGDETGINWMYNRLSLAQGGGLWDDMILVDLRWDLLDLHREITEGVLLRGPGDTNAAVGTFLREHATELERVRGLQRRAAADATPSALAVITARLRALRPSAGRAESG